MPISRKRRTVRLGKFQAQSLQTTSGRRRRHRRHLKRQQAALGFMAPQLPPQSGKRREQFSRPLRVTGRGKPIGWGFA